MNYRVFVYLLTVGVTVGISADMLTPESASAKDIREIRVIAAMDASGKAKLRGFKWEGYFKEVVSRATESTKKQVGVKFVLDEVVGWEGAEALDSAAKLLTHLGNTIQADGSVVVMGLTARHEVLLGEMTDYRGGRLIVRVTGDRDETSFWMARGFVRLLGGLTLKERGTMMGRNDDRKARLRLSDETVRILQIHRDRPFGQGAFPLSRGQIHQALDAYTDLMKDAREPGELLIRQGLLEQAQGDLPAALALFATGLSLLPSLSITRFDLDQIHSALDEGSGEVTPERLVLQGKLADLEGNREKAVEFYDQALQQDSTLFAGHYGVGRVYLDARHWEKAQRHLEAAVRLDKNLPGLFIDLGDVYLAIGKSSAARWAAREALKLDPGMAPAHGMVAQTFVADRKNEEAEAACEEAFSLDRNDGRSRMALAQVYIHKGRGEKAVKQAKRAVAKLPNSAEAHYTLGNAFLSNEEFKHAAEAFESAIGRGPNHAKAHTHLAIAYYNLQELEQALEHARKGLSLGFREAKGIADAISKAMR